MTAEMTRPDLPAIRISPATRRSSASSPESDLITQLVGVEAFDPVAVTQPLEVPSVETSLRRRVRLERGQGYYDEPAERYYDEPARGYYDEAAQRSRGVPAEPYYDEPAERYYDEAAQRSRDEPARGYYDEAAQRSRDVPAEPYYDEAGQRSRGVPAEPYYDEAAQRSRGVPAEPCYDERPGPYYDESPGPRYVEPADQYSQRPDPNYDEPTVGIRMDDLEMLDVLASRGVSPPVGTWSAPTQTRPRTRHRADHRRHSRRPDIGHRTFVMVRPARSRSARRDKPPRPHVSEVTGPLAHGNKVRYRHTLSRRQKWTLAVLTTVTAGAGVSLLCWLAVASLGRPAGAIAIVLIVLMLLLEANRIWQSLHIVIFAIKARDPIPLVPVGSPRVAVLTTIVPGKEPLDMVLKTLRAMKAMKGEFDVWLLDEGNDPAIRRACEEIGVKHFSRKGVSRYHQPGGAFRTKSKAGNHNAWRDTHGWKYDIAAQMDPDHLPFENFLERLLGYFNDPDVAFVVAPMVYGNWDGADYGGEPAEGNWIAHGAAQQAMVFQGVTQRGLNGLDAPLLIGTNHAYRVAAWDHIGGYQDSIIEDHLTAMVVYANHNPVTGNRWRGVYTPDILAVGEAPTSFTDWYNQQKRWAYGMWEIILHHSRHVLPKQKFSQRLSYGLLQPYYPSVALNWLLSVTLTSLYMVSRVSLHLPVLTWVCFWSSSVASCMVLSFWFRRFNLTDIERREWGIPGMALMLMTLPVYVVAGVSKVCGRKLVYAVTAKGDLASPDNIKTFRPHLLWVAWSAVMLGLSASGTVSAWPGLLVWATLTGVIAVASPVVHYTRKLAAKQPQPVLEAVPERRQLTTGKVYRPHLSRLPRHARPHGLATRTHGVPDGIGILGLYPELHTRLSVTQPRMSGRGRASSTSPESRRQHH